MTSAWSLGVLDRIGAGLEQVSAEGAWSLSQVLAHLAQSVEYSMDGYPELKSGLFRATVGPVAFGVFSRRGELSHGLDEAIPGAPTLDAAVDPAEALARLRAAIERFGAHRGSLQPHFAYGKLTHPEYERAHAMHLADHLTELTGVPAAG